MTTVRIPKLERLMNLVAALLHTSVPISAATIRERVAGYPADTVAFRQQFHRDKDDLRVMGVPIEMGEVPDSNPRVDGYRIDPEQYYLPDPGLEPDELAALHLAARLIDVGGSRVRVGLFKLGGMADDDGEGPPPWASVPTDPELGVAFDAIRTRHAVTFDYRNRARRVAPRALGFRNGHWYLSAWDLEAEAERVFRLDRISGGIERAEAIEEPPGETGQLGQMQPWRIGGDDPVTVRIAVDPVAVPTMAAEVDDPEAITLDDDGSAIVTLQVTDADGFCAWVLGFGAAVEVLDPPELRAGMLRRVSR